MGIKSKPSIIVDARSSEPMLTQVTPSAQDHVPVISPAEQSIRKAVKIAKGQPIIRLTGELLSTLSLQVGHSFTRLFTILRAVLWSKLDLLKLLACYGTAPGSFRNLARPEQAYFPGFLLSCGTADQLLAHALPQAEVKRCKNSKLRFEQKAEISAEIAQKNLDSLTYGMAV